MKYPGVWGLLYLSAGLTILTADVSAFSKEAMAWESRFYFTFSCGVRNRDTPLLLAGMLIHPLKFWER